MTEHILLSADDVRRAVVRIAHEIVEAHRGTQDLLLIGMRTRGLPLAKRLARLIEEIEGESVPVGALDVTLYRDDLATAAPPSSWRPESSCRTSRASASSWWTR